MNVDPEITRRRLLELGVALPPLAALAGRGDLLGDVAEAATAPLAPTRSIADADDEPTPAQTEGPYFTPDSPERASLLEEDMPGTRLVLAGYVFSAACRPVADALIDFWHADDNGEYDNAGYRLRGHQFTDEAGRYELTTIVPGIYTGRTRHIHVKVQAPNQPVLTTQLYFPDEPGNERDGIFDPSLVIDQEEGTADEEGRQGFFNFVLDVA
jgi:protocatechuate 3,4-dioxygenase beta subunit